MTVATSAGRGTAERGRGPCQAGEGWGRAVNCQHIVTIFHQKTRDTSSGSSGGSGHFERQAARGEGSSFNAEVW